MTSPVDLEEFRAGYLAEVDEHLRAVRSHVVQVEDGLTQGRPEPRAVRDMFRSMHTIKGLSAMVAVEPIVELAHAMESLLREADASGGALSARELDLLHQGVRAVETRVAALAERRPVPEAPPALLVDLAAAEDHAGVRYGAAGRLELPPEIDGKLDDSDRSELAEGVARGRRAVYVDFVPNAALQEAGINITAVRERVSALGDVVKVIPRHRPQSPEAPGGLAFTLIVLTEAGDEDIAAAAQSTAGEVVELAASRPSRVPDPDEDEMPAPGAPGVVRVDIRRLDETLEHLAAMVVTRHRLAGAVARQRAAGIDSRELHLITGDFGRQLRDLRSAVMRARMVPVRELFERVPLVVRGMTRGGDKQVDVHIDGGDAELDKAVAERLLGPIVHLVRNAVDHGIGSPAERLAAGKPERARLDLTARARGDNTLEVVIEDDGRGIDAEAVARRAGRPTPTDSRELLDLLATPGFSTRDRATTSSGRGMGVDIVRRVVAGELGGVLELDTEPGRGTRFKLRVPVSVSIIDAFTFTCGGQPFAVPVGLVEEIVEVDPARVLVLPSFSRSRATDLLDRRGEAVPLIELDRLFQLEPQPVLRRKAIIVRREDQSFAFSVDRMLGQQEVVLRPIEDPLVRVPGVTGSTDLGDGQPTLVLDLLALAPRGKGAVA